MKVSVAYAKPERQFWMTLDLPEGATIREAIEGSTLLNQFPEIDLGRQKVGVYGKIVPLETRLADGDRVEVYRALTADPKTLRQRAEPGASGGEA